MKALALVAALLLVACEDADATRRTLEASGFTDVRTTGWSAFGCGQGDVYSTGFVATGPSGQRVSGVVCCGWLKRCTVRL